MKNKTEFYLALIIGCFGAHRFYLKQPLLGFLYLLTFIVFPILAVFLALVDAVFLLLTPIDDYKTKTRSDWKTKIRRRIYIYAPLIIIYLGTPFLPWISPKNYSAVEGESFYTSFILPKEKMPIFYRDEYNIHFFGLENLHPFDSKKYGRIYQKLIQEKQIQESDVYSPPMLSDDFLLNIHPASYLESLKVPMNLVKILEVPVVNFLPWQITHRQVLNPMRYASSGSVLAVKSAWDRGWAINLGGGFHHAWEKSGSGFCAFADITLAIKNIRKTLGRDLKVMIIDLDAHQGNGHERDFLDDPNTFIVDIYNPNIFPNDQVAKDAIKLEVKTNTKTNDQDYLNQLNLTLAAVENIFTPELVVYVAGTDIMEGDPLGRMNISPKGIIKRDEIVFQWAKNRKIPITMLLAGGYQKTNADVIAESIKQLLNGVLKGL